DEEGAEMALHRVQLGGEVADMADFDVLRIETGGLQPAFHRLAQHRHDVLVLLVPVASEIRLIPAQDVNWCRHARLLHDPSLWCRQPRVVNLPSRFAFAQGGQGRTGGQGRRKRSPLRAGPQSETVTRRKVAGIEVPPPVLWFCAFAKSN